MTNPDIDRAFDKLIRDALRPLDAVIKALSTTYDRLQEDNARRQAERGKDE